MTTVRELLISFGTEIDGNSLKKTGNQVKGAAQGMQKILSTALQSAFVIGVARAAFELTKLASVVEENMNVLRVSFEQSSQDVLNWSEDFARATGRSKYELQKTASTFGALLRPMLGSSEAAAKMSTGLSELTVDLASFYQIADSEVLSKLRAGITGESEPLKQLGVIMNVASLEAYAMSQNIGKAYKSMDEAEKTNLRYNFILEKTAHVHGDAAKTALSFENSAKAVEAAFKDIGTEIGLKLLPFMSKLNQGILWVTGAFSKLTAGTKIIEALLITLGATAVAVGIKLLIAFSPILVPIALVAGAIALVGIALEDFYTFLQGGDSVIGRFIDSIFGPGSATDAAEKMGEAWEGLKYLWENQLLPSLRELGSAFVEFVQLVKPLVGDLFEFMAGMIRTIVEGWRLIFDLLINYGIPAFKDFANSVESALKPVFAWIGEKIDWLVPKLEWLLSKIQMGSSAAARFLGFNVEYSDDETGQQRKEGQARRPGRIGRDEEPVDEWAFQQPKEALPGPYVAGYFDKTEREKESRSGTSTPTQSTPNPFAFAPVQPSVPASQVSNADNRSTQNNNVTQNVTESTTVNVHGDATPQTARTIAERANEGNREVNRKTLAALQQKARAS